MQGYKVYQDPEGTHTLDHSKNNTEATNNKTAVDNDGDNGYYKKRIISLNEEIKNLNDELAKVKIY